MQTLLACSFRLWAPGRESVLSPKSRDNVPLNPGKCVGSNKCYAIPNSCLPYRSRITTVCHQSVYCVYAWGDFGREYQLMCRIGLKIFFFNFFFGGGLSISTFAAFENWVWQCWRCLGWESNSGFCCFAACNLASSRHWRLSSSVDPPPAGGP